MTIQPLFPAATLHDIRSARLVLLRPMGVAARDVRTACHVLLCSDSEADRERARASLRMLDREDQLSRYYDEAALDDAPGPGLTGLWIIAAGILIAASLVWGFVELGRLL